jgi:hypothetical protein
VCKVKVGIIPIRCVRCVVPITPNTPIRCVRYRLGIGVLGIGV